jgi:integrase
MYLKRKYNVWIAHHTIPPSLRPFFFNRPRFKKSTGEEDKSRATAKAAEFAAHWFAQLAAARDALRRGDSPISFQIDRSGKKLPNIATILGLEPEESLEIAPIGVEKVGRPHGLSAHVDDWISTLIGDQPKTKHMKKADAELFAERFVTAESVSKKAVQTWVNGEIAAGAAVATVRRKLSNLRGFWGYLQSLEIVDEDTRPLDRLVLPAAKATATDVKPFTTAEVVDLAARARTRKDQELADAIAIASYTGARIEEISTLEIRHVLKADIVLPGTKSDAAPRRLPIHRDLLPVLRRLVGRRKTGYLFPDLSPNKFGDRSNALGKRFGRLKSGAGFGRDRVFHSIRKTFANQLWSAGVHPELISQLQGHSTGSLTLDVYAQDPARPAKAKAIAVLSYPGLVA